MNDLDNLSFDLDDNQQPRHRVGEDLCSDSTQINLVDPKVLHEFIDVLLDCKSKSYMLSENYVENLMKWSGYIENSGGEEALTYNQYYCSTLNDMIETESKKRGMLSPVQLEVSDLFSIDNVLFRIWLDNNMIDEYRLSLFLTYMIKNKKYINDNSINKLMSMTNLNNYKKILLDSYKKMAITTEEYDSSSYYTIDILGDSYHCERKACARLILSKLNKEPYNNSVKQIELLSELLKKESNYNLYLWILYIVITTSSSSSSSNQQQQQKNNKQQQQQPQQSVNSKMLIDLLKKDNKVRAQFNLACNDDLLKSLIAIDKTFFEFHQQTLFTVFDHYCFKVATPNTERVNLLINKFKSIHTLSKVNQEIGNQITSKLQPVHTKSKTTKLLNPDLFNSIYTMYFNK
ncbi:hypothetical protein PPL_07891 [Heterostelium album PN500]|uniref:Uncharacterized protein n=1 Tax=Heterostelium pallidum (strain ATCC 26659 / Pp 5 / PN500) TaxID=670386 RepID=D3BH89_HETP5|nr:hypothetical protein PPL_07891 [Heterostelium album PN500]EFA79473.1 hypothetical protein PPL_07891 [Heterostelium album PN500]|eukprot:XP_020431594.1 hypothetical protein PPL_07891 [Heterostelium album PN500]